MQKNIKVIFKDKIDISIFDNSWDVYHQDLPTAEYFLNNGIKNIVVKPNTNPTEFNIAFLLFVLFSPIKYEI